MNKVILMGRLTRDPDVRYSQGERATAVARYTLAVNRRFKRDGEPDADFINCVAFGRAGEFARSISARESRLSSQEESRQAVTPTRTESRSIPPMLL